MVVSTAGQSADMSRLRRALLAPQSVALIGASADVAKLNARPQRFLQAAGFKGNIYPINPGREEIFGIKAYPDVVSVPDDIDHALIMVPARAIDGVIDQCCEKGVAVATIFSAGFSELGAEGVARQQKLVARAQAAGMRLLGPNCMGVINVRDGMPLTVNAVVEKEPPRSGSYSVISQSGSMLGAIMSRTCERNIGFSKLVSVGNEADLGVGEITDLLVDDPDTDAILLFLETLRDAPNLRRAAIRAMEIGKPIIAFKLGRSDAGRKAATTHTGAIVGPDEYAATFLRESGILRVDVFESLLELPRLVIGHRPCAGKRVSALTGTGGAAAMVIDRLGALGADVAPPPAELRAQWNALGISVADSPLIDIPMGNNNEATFATILDGLLQSDHCDAAISVVGSSSRSTPETVRPRVLAAEHIGKKPLAVFLAPQADEALRILQEAGVAGFRTPDACADSINAYLNWQEPRILPDIPTAALARARAHAAQSASEWNEVTATGLFEKLGIAVADHAIIDPTGRVSATDAEAAIDGAAAVKLLSPDIAHKTDAGFVKLNVNGQEAIDRTATELIERAKAEAPNARLDGVLVQKMERGLGEVIVGFQRDPEVGPVVMLGMGGIAAELHKSSTVRLAPVDEAEAMRMFDDIPELALLRGYRNLPKGDLAALAKIIVRLSWLAGVDQIDGAEINPVIVKAQGDGAIAVDGLVVPSAGRTNEGKPQ